MRAVCRGEVGCVREMVKVPGLDLKTRDREGGWSLEDIARWVDRMPGC